MSTKIWNSKPVFGGMVCVAALVLSCCATSTTETTLNPVGPKSSGAAQAAIGSVGSLKVYSATQEYTDGQYIYHPHSHYVIYAGDGVYYKSVLNHIGSSDNAVELVDLPPGRYTVLAKSDNDGLVKVPVIIVAGKTTVVNLQNKPISELDRPGIQISYPET